MARWKVAASFAAGAIATVLLAGGGSLLVEPARGQAPAFTALDYAGGFALFSQMMIYTYGLMHYYLDSFIWKVSDRQTQKGL